MEAGLGAATNPSKDADGSPGLSTATIDDAAYAVQLQHKELEADRERLERWHLQQSNWHWLKRALEATGQLGRVTPCINSRTVLADDELSASRKMLEGRIQAYGFDELEVKGDGNCQFRALAHQLHGSQEQHAMVRQVTCNQLRLFGGLYRQHVPGDYAAYVTSMEKDGTWGDNITLQAVADVYKMRMVVLTSYSQNCFVELDPQQQFQPAQRIAFLSFWAEIHYNSLCIADGSSVSTATEEDCLEVQPWQQPRAGRRYGGRASGRVQECGLGGQIVHWLRYGLG